MNVETELRHLISGPNEGEKPEGFGLVQVTVSYDLNETLQLERIKEVLKQVAKASADKWPSLEEWKSILPKWFIDACGPEISKKENEEWLYWWRKLPEDQQAFEAEARQWTLSGWIFWFQPKERVWYWWDSFTNSPGVIRIDLAVLDWPVPLGAFKWLLKASGALCVEY